MHNKQTQGYNAAEKYYNHFQAKIHIIHNVEYCVLHWENGVVQELVRENIIELLPKNNNNIERLIFDKDFLGGFIKYIQEQNHILAIKERKNEINRQEQENKGKNDYLRSRNMIPFLKEKISFLENI